MSVNTARAASQRKRAAGAGRNHHPNNVRRYLNLRCDDLPIGPCDRPAWLQASALEYGKFGDGRSRWMQPSPAAAEERAAGEGRGPNHLERYLS